VQIQCPVGMIVNENNCGSASDTNMADFKPTCTCGDIKAHQRIVDVIIDTQVGKYVNQLVCGLNGQCHPRRDVILVQDAKVNAGGIVGILLAFFAVVVLTGAFVPKLWTCFRGSD
jgi:hypothetical protein